MTKPRKPKPMTLGAVILKLNALQELGGASLPVEITVETGSFQFNCPLADIAFVTRMTKGGKVKPIQVQLIGPDV